VVTTTLFSEGFSKCGSPSPNFQRPHIAPTMRHERCDSGSERVMDNNEMQIKTASRVHAEPLDERSLSPADLVDQIQRNALRDRFRRADVRDYPSLQSVRRAMTVFSDNH